MTETSMSGLQPEREFTELELMRYDGTRGKPAYIAYKGVVYDVSASLLWRGGMHKGIHWSGIDLTDSMIEAPHNDSVCGRIPVVGRLRSTK